MECLRGSEGRRRNERIKADVCGERRTRLDRFANDVADWRAAVESHCECPAALDAGLEHIERRADRRPPPLIGGQLLEFRLEEVEAQRLDVAEENDRLPGGGEAPAAA